MEEMACCVLRIFDATSDDLINGFLLLQKIPYYKINCLKMGEIYIMIDDRINLIYDSLSLLQIAEEADCLKFLSLPVVRDIITSRVFFI